MEWVLLVVLVFALIPVVGGVIKGVGRLALRVAGDAAKDEKLLHEVVAYLNRVGHGDAPQWLRSLNIRSYQAEIIAKLKNFCSTVRRTIQKTLESHLGSLLPQQWHGQLQLVAEGFSALPEAADRMVPKALDELEHKIRVLQNTAYDGEKRFIATGGAPKIERESEAVLQEEVRLRKLPQGEYSAIPAFIENERQVEKLRAKFSAAISQGWPDLFRTEGTMPVFGEKQVYTSIASFHGEIAAWNATQLAGKKVFRVFGNAGTIGGESYAGGMYWGLGNAPGTAKEWRELCAVLDKFNANGYIVTGHLPDNLHELWPEAKAWMGKVAEQYGSGEPLQYLEGGGEQLFANFGGEINKRITDIGNLMKKGELPATHTEEIEGVIFRFYKTNWENIEKLFGYGKAADDTSAASTRKLASEEIRSK
jgi:hypothetical protein